MSITYIANNFGRIATSTEYAQYQQMDLQKYHIYNNLLNTLNTIADNSGYLVGVIEEDYNITTIDTDDLIEILEDLSEGDYDINTDDSILQQFKDLQKEYNAQVEKIAKFKHNIMIGNR